MGNPRLPKPFAQFRAINQAPRRRYRLVDPCRTDQQSIRPILDRIACTGITRTDHRPSTRIRFPVHQAKSMELFAIILGKQPEEHAAMVEANERGLINPSEELDGITKPKPGDGCTE